jgi:pilus assembly protein FimV
MLRKLLVGLASACLILMPLSAQALGFGNIKLDSALNQPLDARIDLLSPTSADIQSLKVSLASEGAFARAGIDRPHYLSGLVFKVVDSDGEPYIQVTSKESIREPFLNFLLEFNWDNGRMLREYTMLLDPPGRMMQAPAPAMAETPVTQEPTDTIERAEPQPYAPAPMPEAKMAMPAEPASQPEPQQTAPAEVEPVVAMQAPAEPESMPEPKPEPVIEKAPAESFDPLAAGPHYEDPFVDDGSLLPRIDISDYREPAGNMELGELDYGVTKKGDNAWTIAQKLQSNAPSASIYQIMMALMQSNPEAFVDGNIHRLKTGQVLRIEDPSLLNAMSRQQAANEYITQTDAWNEYRQAAAERTGRQPVVAEAGAQEAPVRAESGGELTLSSPEGTERQSGAGASQEAMSNDLVALQDELRQVRENASSMRERNVELNRQLQDMEEELARMQRSVTIKDDELAALQKQLADLNAGQTVAEEPASKMAAEEPVVAKPEPEKATAPEPAVEKPAQAKVETEEPKPVAKPKPKTTPPVAAKPKAEPKGMVEEYLDMAKGIFDSAMDMVTGMVGDFGGNKLLIYVAAPVLVVLLILMMIVMRRRRKAEGNYQESILSGGPSTVTNSGEASEAGESSFLSDFAVSGAGAIQTEDSEVDPLTEADVFMAYGRYEAAEERLQEAIEQEPGRKELKLKLLELFAANNKGKEFENLAEEFYATLGGDADSDPQWEKVVAMGKDVAPNNPLFAGAAAAPAAMQASEDPGVGLSDSQVMDIGLDTGVFESGDFAAEQPQEQAAESELDFNFDLGGGTETAESESTGDLDLNLDIGGGEDQTAETDMGGLDFNLGDEESTKDDLSFDLDTGGESDAGGLSLDMGGSEDQTAETDMGGLDFNMGSDEGTLSMDSVEETASDDSTMAIDTGGLDFDTGDEGGMDLDLNTGASQGGADMDLGGGDEVGTKLDLARAYIDMGDPDGARSILDEVMDEGNDSQKQEAQQLLQQIA